MELPAWKDGTVAVLSTGAGAPHAIPVSTAVRAGPRTILLALALRRESLDRLRREPRCALTIVTQNTACTAHATAAIVEEPLAEAGKVAAVRLDVDEVQDHLAPTYAIEGGVPWRWTDADASARDAGVRAGLQRLAGGR